MPAGNSYEVSLWSDGGAFAAWQQQVTDASATFTGQYGHTYGFYSVATDGLGFREATPAAAQAVTALVAPFAGSASMTGPAGAGPLHAVVSGSTLSYSIGFQNDSAVGGPAIKQLVVTEQLDSTLDWSSFQFSRVGFGAVTVTGSGTSFQTTVSTTNADGMPLRVTVAGSVNMKTGVVTWTLRSIDPATNQTPTGPWAGFLPAADPTGRSKGFLECAIKLKAGLATGTEVRSQAAATFDGTTIASNNYSNVVDSGFPTSTVAPLPATQSVESFTVSWSGTDSAAQAGIAYYDVYVSTDGGRFRRWQARTTATSATFTGQFGHTYAFYSVATDALGFRLSTRAYAQATTSLNAPLRSPTQTRRGTRLFSFKP